MTVLIEFGGDVHIIMMLKNSDYFRKVWTKEAQEGMLEMESRDDFMFVGRQVNGHYKWFFASEYNIAGERGWRFCL